MRNLIIGRKFIEESTPEYFKLEIIDKGYYKYALIMFYGSLCASLSFSIKIAGFLGLVLYLFVFALSGSIFYIILSPISINRYVQIDEDGITISEGLAFDAFHGKLSWSNIKKIEKTIYGYQMRHAYGSTSKFYKFTRKRGKEVEMYCIVTSNFEDEFLRMAKQKKISIEF